jgi:hypothetical protein
MSIELIRLEYKLDLLLRALQSSPEEIRAHAAQGQGLLLPGPMPPLMDIERDSCPICERQYKLVSDFASETQHLTCGCRVPFTPVQGISALLKKEVTNAGSGTEASDEGLPGEEEGTAGHR